MGAPDARRFAVYRNNVAVGLIGALEARYPVSRRIAGDDLFRAMARAFVRAHRPRSPVMIAYGGQFPEFAAGYLAAAGPGADLREIPPEFTQGTLRRVSSPLVGEDQGGGSRRPTRRAGPQRIRQSSRPHDPHPYGARKNARPLDGLGPPPQEGAGALPRSIPPKCSRPRTLLAAVIGGERALIVAARVRFVVGPARCFLGELSAINDAGRSAPTLTRHHLGNVRSRSNVSQIKQRINRNGVAAQLEVQAIATVEPPNRLAAFDAIASLDEEFVGICVG
jgi:hypothetical protein